MIDGKKPDFCNHSLARRVWDGVYTSFELEVAAEQGYEFPVVYSVGFM